METEIKGGSKEEGQAEPGSVNGLLGSFHEPPVQVGRAGEGWRGRSRWR